MPGLPWKSGLSGPRVVIPSLNVLRSFPIRPKLLRHRLQRRIKLHKNMLDRSMLLMTIPAPGLRISASGFRVFVKIEVGPFVGKPTLVFHLDADPHRIGLIVSQFVDRAFTGRTPIFHDEHRLVGPFAGLHELPVSPLRHKDVGEHFVASLRAVAHAKAGGQKNPLAIIGRGQQSIVASVLREPTITLAACYAVRQPHTTSRRYVSAGKPERRDPRPGSSEGQTASHRAKSPRHATHYPVLETLPARDLARRPIQARKLARARPPFEARRNDCAGAKPLSIHRAIRREKVSPDRSSRAGAH